MEAAGEGQKKPSNAGGSGADGDDGKPAPESVTVLWQLLAAVATGIGVLGLVTFFGGAILWVRADKAGLPANEAIGVVPSPVLVTTGASFLVPAVLLALLAVALLMVADLVLKGLGLRRKARAESLKREAEEKKKEAAICGAKADLMRAAGAELDQSAGHEEAGGRDEDDVSGAPEVQARAEQLASAAQTAAKEATRLEAKVKVAEAEHDTTKAEAVEELAPLPGTLVFLLFLGLLFGIEVAATLGDGVLGEIGVKWVIAVIVIAIVSLAISALIYVSTQRLIFFGMAVFLSIGLFIAATTYVRTSKNPKVEPAAILREGKGPLTGFLVAETSDRVYLGVDERARIAARTGSHMIVIPRAEISDLLVGPLVTLKAREGAAARLALELCSERTRAAKAKATRAQARRPACTRDQTEALRRQAAAS